MRCLWLVVTAACSAAPELASTSAPAIACGPGTHVESATCVLDYDLLVSRKLGAIERRNRVRLFGTQPDGTPAIGDVVFSVEPAAAGTFTKPVARMGRLGAETFFVPCKLGPNCPPAAALSAALASEPAQVVARVDVELVDPIEVNPAKDCLGGGTILKIAGDDALLNGTRTIHDPTWTFPNTGVKRDLWRVRVTPQSGGDEWFIDFNTVSLGGELVVGKVYEDVSKAFFSFSDQTLGHPAMNIARTNFECTSVKGLFEVVDYVVDFSTPDPHASVATFYFEQHCDGDPATRVTGCLHYQQ